MNIADEQRVLRARDRILPLGGKTYVMAIINLTDDSFSGDGTGRDLDAAVRRAVAAVREGADIIDVGGESARADVPVRDPEDEAQIVGAAVRRIAREVDALISVDTYKRPVAESAVAAGAGIINDIGGILYDAGTAEIAAAYGAALVINYTYERPKIRPSAPPQYDDVVQVHIRYLRERVAIAEEAGVGEQSIIVDPGIAFGKSHDEDIEVIRRLSAFRVLRKALLVAHSRKHFIGSVLGLPPDERDGATAAVTALCVANGADVVRVHNVRINVQAARVADAIVRGRSGDYRATAETWPWWERAEPIAGTVIGDV